MCTISWLVSPTGYQVFFNRDEQVTRAKARLPETISVGNSRAIMPIDPQGDGTWCAVNEHGLTVALLNFYQGRLPKGRLISRGQVVRNCAQFAKLSEVKDHIQQLNLAKHAPFSLLVFTPHMSGGKPRMLRWDGRELTESSQECPLISSAVNYEKVHASRINVFRDFILDGSDSNEESYLRLHASHLPSKSDLSVCMHRDDARTVSFSQVIVDSDMVRFRYADGPPCEAPIIEVAPLERTSRSR